MTWFHVYQENSVETRARTLASGEVTHAWAEQSVEQFNVGASSELN